MSLITRKMPVMVEIGPKGKKYAAVARDWPGLERNGKSEAEAVTRMESYVPRYARVARRAGLAVELDTYRGSDVVERYTGSGSTDFWGISFVPAETDQEPMTDDALERQITLLQACWDEFDDIAFRVSAELKKGPRGGGRDRDPIISHTFGVEQDWATKLRVETPPDAMLTAKGLKKYREDVRNAIRGVPQGGQAGEEVAAALLHSPQRLSRDGSRVGNGGQGPDQRRSTGIGWAGRSPWRRLSRGETMSEEFDREFERL